MNYKENKQVLLTLFITMIMMATTIFTFGQTTINPDTVCVNATGEQYICYQYTYINIPMDNYRWRWCITNWTRFKFYYSRLGSSTSGLYPNAVEVIETNASNCPGTPILLDVYVLDLSGNAIGPFCPGDPSTILVGNPAGGTWTGTGVVGNDFDPATAGTRELRINLLNGRM